MAVGPFFLHAALNGLMGSEVEPCGPEHCPGTLGLSLLRRDLDQDLSLRLALSAAQIVGSNPSSPPFPLGVRNAEVGQNWSGSVGGSSLLGAQPGLPWPFPEPVHGRLGPACY